MNTIKAVARSVSFSSRSSSSRKSGRFEREKLEPIVGFQMTLYDSAADGPQLDVTLVGARHLPSNFGLKSVEGYQVKVKIFPGTAKFDSSIQQTSWPTFNETFRFPMSPSHKSAMKSKNRDYKKNCGNFSSLPEKVFNGNFVVFTVVALLELPNGSSNSAIKETYKTLKRQGSLMLKNSAPKILSTLNMTPSTTNDPKPSETKPKIQKLTTSESQRNIGSVTFFLDAKTFEENTKMRTFQTGELWLPVRDITAPCAPNSRLSVQSSPKGQVEMLLELCDNSSTDDDQYDRSMNPFECNDDEESTSTTSKSRFSLSDMKFTNVKRFVRRQQREKQSNSGLCLKVTTSKMRCSIKVKEEFENDTNQIYIKTTVFEREILSGSWKSGTFCPTLSTRFDPIDSTIVIQIPDEAELEHITIKVQVATKTKIGKKIVLGTVYIHPDDDNSIQHFTSMSMSHNNPIPMWYSFE